MEGIDKSLQYTMSKDTFEQQFLRCGYNYDLLIGQLRLDDKGEVTFS